MTNSYRLLYLPQRWFVQGTLECFTGYHTPLVVCAVFVLLMCVLVIPLLGLVATGILKVASYCIIKPVSISAY